MFPRLGMHYSTLQLQQSQGVPVSGDDGRGNMDAYARDPAGGLFADRTPRSGRRVSGSISR